MERTVVPIPKSYIYNDHNFSRFFTIFVPILKEKIKDAMESLEDHQESLEDKQSSFEDDILSLEVSVEKTRSDKIIH